MEQNANPEDMQIADRDHNPSKTREEPLYVSCAFDERYAYIISVHSYDPALWIDPWTRRKE
jgi:hypothetical protein